MKNKLYPKVHYLAEALCLLRWSTTQRGKETEMETEETDSQSQGIREEFTEILAPVTTLRYDIYDALEQELGKQELERLTGTYFYSLSGLDFDMLVHQLYSPLLGDTPAEIDAFYATLERKERNEFLASSFLQAVELEEKEEFEMYTVPEVEHAILHSELPDKSKVILLTVCSDFDMALAECGMLLSKAMEQIKKQKELLEALFYQGVEEIERRFVEEKDIVREIVQGINEEKPMKTIPVVLGADGAQIYLEFVGKPYQKVEQLVLYGILVHTLLAAKEKSLHEEERAGYTLRTLGDNTKQQILKALGTRPLYGQELADLTQLTPATISYHMNLLLQEQFVYVEKKAGRIYYHLNQPVLQERLLGVMKYFGLNKED